MAITTLSTMFEKELLKAIQEEREIKSNNLIAGMSVTDYVSYRENVAYIRALDAIAVFCEKIGAELSKES